MILSELSNTIYIKIFEIGITIDKTFSSFLISKKIIKLEKFSSNTTIFSFSITIRKSFILMFISTSKTIPS